MPFDAVAAKVFDALESGVLPVYYGAPNVDDFVPPGACPPRRKPTSYHPRVPSVPSSMPTHPTLRVRAIVAIEATRMPA